MHLHSGSNLVSAFAGCRKTEIQNTGLALCIDILVRQAAKLAAVVHALVHTVELAGHALVNAVELVVHAAEVAVVDVDTADIAVDTAEVAVESIFVVV